MIKRSVFASMIALIVIFMSAEISNAQASKDWQLRTVTFTSYGSGISHEYRYKPIPIEILRSKGAADGVGDVAFVCAYGDLNFRIQVEPGDIYETIRSNLDTAYDGSSNPRRTFRPKVNIAGKEHKKAKWIEGKQDRVVMPLTFKSSAQLYNAVVKGQEVHFTRKKNTIILNLPKPNDDFKAFGESCLRK